EEPASTLAATAAYIYHRAHLPLVERYLDEGNSADQPGRFIGWLHARAPVYGYRFEGEWRDIGDAEQLLEADNLMRGRVGLPRRAHASGGRGARAASRRTRARLETETPPPPASARGRGALLDLVLPQRCVACGCLGEQLCEPCLARLPRIAPPLCARCGAPTA